MGRLKYLKKHLNSVGRLCVMGYRYASRIFLILEQLAYVAKHDKHLPISSSTFKNKSNETETYEKDDKRKSGIR